MKKPEAAATSVPPLATSSSHEKLEPFIGPIASAASPSVSSYRDAQPTATPSDSRYSRAAASGRPHRPPSTPSPVTRSRPPLSSAGVETPVMRGVPPRSNLRKQP